MRPTTMVDNNCIIEGNVKFRDGKKWKSRWCVMRKLSPVADCLHLQLYGDSKDRYKQGQTKASLSLQHFLGVESGFTLDKESNTIAIICQDLIVVLAFDTRERLIQWQVKISNNLGEDQQFLIMISTAPSKAKVSNGPAHLHIQDRRFCITVGVPPRLVGVWEIAHLRRYGVVEGRFCFEGGSRCGRGEGLHVLITDQGDDIVKTLQLAAEGRLATRKRPLGRDISGHDSPRRQFIRSDTRVSDFFPTTVYSTYKEQFEITKPSEISPCWSSTESRHNATELDGDYNCRETGSVIELTNQQSEWRSGSLPRQSTSGLERCASCISKLGAISKTSACAAVSTVAVTTHSPVSVNNPNNLACHSQQPRAFDRLSLSSYSSSSHDSDYSASQIAESTNSIATKISPSQEQQYQKEQSQQQQQQQQQPEHCSSPIPTTSPPRPQKPSNVTKKPKKPPMPLPIEQQVCTCKQKPTQKTIGTRIKSGPYENYDVPKTILAHHMSLEPPAATQADQYYDTPRKIKECLALPKNYPNYDTPHAPQAVVLQHCGCPTKMPAQSPRSSGCPCHNVMSWAGFVLPYCRRGAGIEQTGVTVHPVKLSGEGKMPVVNASGELAIYPVNSRSHHDIGNKNFNIRTDSCAYNYSSNSNANNYENIEPVIDTQPESKQANYVNIDFKEALEHYENSRDVIARSGISQEEIQVIADELKDTTNNIAMVSNEKCEEAEQSDCDDHKVDKICNKCGHVKDNATNYLLMDPDNQSMKKPFAGYLPMQPAHNACSKDVISRICGGNKSSSNPTLFGSSLIDAGRKRSDSELRIPGSAMLSSPYLRRRLIDPSHVIDATVSLEMLWRKRSYSAESTNYLEDTSPDFSSTVPIHKCPSETNKLLSINKNHHQSMICTNSDFKVNRECEESNINSQPFSIKIRRSSSVPSKTGHNRDSSSSNDSGVSTGSLTHRNAEFVEFEFSLAPINSSKKNNILTVCRKSPPPICYHSSLPRKSKSSDPLREISFQFQKLKIPTKSSSAEGDIPTCMPKGSKGFSSPGETSSTPYIDSRSTSSGTSDMSDYIETLSLSSHSSSDAPESLRLGGRAVTTTLRPRSGKEYYKLDRSILAEQNRAMTTTSSSYANITPVLEKSESPSPGYMSSSPFEQPQPSRDHFLFPEEA